MSVISDSQAAARSQSVSPPKRGSTTMHVGDNVTNSQRAHHKRRRQKRATGQSLARVTAFPRCNFGPDNRDRRREHEDDEAPGDVDAGYSRDEGHGYDTGGRDEQHAWNK